MTRCPLRRIGSWTWRWWLVVLVVVLAVAVALRALVILGSEEPPGALPPEAGSP